MRNFTSNLAWLYLYFPSTPPMQFLFYSVEGSAVDVLGADLQYILICIILEHIEVMRER